ncbi:MAG: PAS domain S-box protein [Desulfobacterales bacterium]
MTGIFAAVQRSLAAKLILSVGLILLLTITTWSYFSIAYQKRSLEQQVVQHTDTLGDAIKLGAHYAMMLNAREDINQIITNMGRLPQVRNIRIYNKEGAIKFSNRSEEVEQVTNIMSEACHICHHSEPARVEVGLRERIRYFRDEDGQAVLGLISPIYNEPGCATGGCHFHPADKQVLGALDVVVSLSGTEDEIRFMEKGVLGLALAAFLVTSAMIFLFVLRFVNRPIRSLIAGTQAISHGDYNVRLTIDRTDEMGQLAAAMNFMCQEIGEKQAELNRQRDEYLNLFNTVPCVITVQDRDFRLLQYNREFADLFDPRPGDFCYHAYKGRSEPCPHCPVEKTFADGRIHLSEERGIHKDGSPAYWLVKTTPIRNAEGEIVAAMEVNLDITHLKQLEFLLERSERKYHEIFNNIPNPLFVLDAESLEIRDGNEAVARVYGFSREEILGKNFLDLFPPEDRARIQERIRRSNVIHQMRQLRRDGSPFYVDMWISPAEYPGRRALLVTTSDITQRLETEQQLIQASKMATLGEMATGVAHELNQPLAVIKTASRFFVKKVRAGQEIAPEVLATMAEEIDSHVDRASRIINHLREFGRKSEQALQPVSLNEVLRRTAEMFSQQLKSRGIEIVWDLAEELPPVLAETNRLEQVFINLLINARDAIEERVLAHPHQKGSKKIFVSSRREGAKVLARVEDTGTGIPPAVLARIFEPFFTTKKVGKGTGLGLSISYQIVRDFGGTIRAESMPGEGAVFIVELPAQEVG